MDFCGRLPVFSKNGGKSSIVPVLRKSATGHTLAVTHRDESRLLQHAHGLAQRIAVGTVLRRELALAG